MSPSKVNIDVLTFRFWRIKSSPFRKLISQTRFLNINSARTVISSFLSSFSKARNCIFLSSVSFVMSSVHSLMTPSSNHWFLTIAALGEIYFELGPHMYNRDARLSPSSSITDISVSRSMRQSSSVRNFSWSDLLQYLSHLAYHDTFYCTNILLARVQRNVSIWMISCFSKIIFDSHVSVQHSIFTWPSSLIEQTRP